MRLILSILLLSVCFAEGRTWPEASTGTCGKGAGEIGDSWEPGLGLCLLDCTNPQDQLRLADSVNYDNWWEWSTYSDGSPCATGAYMGAECCFMCGDGVIDNTEECDPGSTIGSYSYDPSPNNPCATCNSDCTCFEEGISGCMDETACNYNAGASVDDGSCWSAYEDNGCDCEDGQLESYEVCDCCDGWGQCGEGNYCANYHGNIVDGIVDGTCFYMSDPTGGDAGDLAGCATCDYIGQGCCEAGNDFLCDDDNWGDPENCPCECAAFGNDGAYCQENNYETEYVNCGGSSWPDEIGYAVYDGWTGALIYSKSHGCTADNEEIFIDEDNMAICQCDSYGDGWNGATLNVGNKAVPGPTDACSEVQCVCNTWGNGCCPESCIQGAGGDIFDGWYEDWPPTWCSNLWVCES